MIEWLMERLNIEDSGKFRSPKSLLALRLTSFFLGGDFYFFSVEAIHMANLLCQHGYFFPVGECNKNLSVKDDSSLYRFQVNTFFFLLLLSHPFAPRPKNVGTFFS